MKRVETEESRCKNIQRDNFLGKKVDEGQQQRIRPVFLKVRQVIDLQHGTVWSCWSHSLMVGSAVSSPNELKEVWESQSLVQNTL